MTPDTRQASPTRSALRRRARRRRRRWLPVVISLAVLVTLVGCIVGGAALVWQQTVANHLTTLPAAQAFPDEKGRPAPSGDGSQNYLLLGSDSRLDPDDHDLAAAGDQRSDVAMLVHVPADRSGIQVTSFLRDLWVPVPGHGEAKLNAALAWGGTALTIATIENLVHTRIDHVAIIDFDGLAAMTTALGGIRVDNAVPFTRHDKSLEGGSHFYAQGPIMLEGVDALEYVRERKAFPTGDYQRVKNQQQLLKGILDRAISRDVLSNPAALTAFVSETSKNLTVDSGFTLPVAAALAFGLRGIDSHDITLFTAPTDGTGTSPDGQSIVKVDPQGMSELAQALADDTLPAFAAKVSAGK